MKKKWRMKTKRPRKLHKRILSAFLVYILLTGLFLSAANMEVSAASGLVDETIDAGNLYSQYRWDNYQIDFYVDTSWDWLPWNWMDRIDNKISSVFYGISDGIWLISVLLSSGTGYIVQQTYSLDFIGDMADDIGKNIQILAGMNTGSKKIHAGGYFPAVTVYRIDRGRLHGICRADQKKNHRGSQRSGKYACDLSFNCRVYCLCAAVH